MRALLIIFLLLMGHKAFSFPHLVTHGYSCSSCHIAPTGGGILNKYGRSQSENLLSSFAQENEGQFLHGLGTPDWLLLGGDARWLNVSRKSKNFDYSKLFFMQTEGQLALKPISGLTFVGSIGKYNEDDKLEYRTTYAMLDLDEHWHLRLGNLIPAYGLLLPDHTAFVSAGQDANLYAFEIYYNSLYFELFFTRAFGRDRTLDLTHNEGPKLRRKRDEEGYLFKAATHLFKWLNFGYSYHKAYVSKHGPSAILGIGDWTFLLQHDVWLFPSNGDRGTSIFTEAQANHLRGIQPFVNYQERRDKAYTQRVGGGIRLYPRPHFEFEAKYELEKSGLNPLHTYLFMAHYYL